MFEYREFCETLAKQASEIINEAFVKAKTVHEKESSSGPQVVTDTDRQINQLVIDAVQKTFPGHDVLGEEQSDMSNNSDFLWICDPIDGTLPFVLGIPTMTFSLGLAHKGEIIAGVVAHPMQHVICYAEKGKGTWIGDKQQRVRKKEVLPHIGITEWTTAPYRCPGLHSALIDAGYNIFDLGSVALMGMYVATGALEGVLFSGEHVHDIAAIHILVEEAGGRVTDYDGNPITYCTTMKGCIASNGAQHESFLAFVQKTCKRK